MKRFYKRFLSVFMTMVFILPCMASAEMVDSTEETVEAVDETESTEVVETEETTAAVAEADYGNGGWAITLGTQTVRSGQTSSSAAVGTVYAGEGITVLLQYPDSLYIEYSSPSGAKRGYLVGPYIVWDFIDHSRVGTVRTTANLYYGPDTSLYPVSGTVYAGETVVVLALRNGWFYIEYNTTSGRKRGYIPYGNIATYGAHQLPDFYTATAPVYISGTKNVLAGPGPQYPVIGSVSNETIRMGTVFYLYGNYCYSEYDVTGTGQKKTGYIAD